MTGKAYAFADALRKLVRIRRLAPEKGLRDRILGTYVQTVLLKRVDTRNRIANVAGRRMRYANYDSYCFLFNEIFINQEYHFVTQNPRPLIIDCGSNIGMSVLYFKLVYPDSRIIAFEPDEDAFACLKANVEANGLSSVDIHRNVVSGTEGIVDFHYDPENPGTLAMSVIPERLPKEKRKVEAVRLSRFITSDVDFLKMDIEGSEPGVMEELAAAGSLNHVRQMAIEYHHHIDGDRDALSSFLGILEKAGFGYQVQGGLGRPLEPRQFQDVLIYAYRKSG